MTRDDVLKIMQTTKDLSDADLRDADLRETKISGANKTLPIFRIDGLDWDISYCFGILQIGCKKYNLDFWENVTETELNEMDKNAKQFWDKYGKLILGLCHAKNNEQNTKV